MAFQVVRNDVGNIVEFRGASQPVYFNGALSAVVDTLSSGTVNIINRIQSVNIEALSGRSYEFYQIPYTEWRDGNDDSFPSALSAVSYINTQVDVAILTVDDSSGYNGILTSFYAPSGGNVTQLLSADVYTPLVASVYEVYDENILSAQDISNGTIPKNVVYSSNESFSAVLSSTLDLGSNNGAVDVGVTGLDADGSLTSVSKPVIFSFAGQDTGSYDSLRVDINVTPEENESALTLRVKYMYNVPSQISTGLSALELERRTITFQDGAGISYRQSELFQFFAGDTLRDTDSDNPSWDNSGFYFVEALPNVPMDCEVLSMVQFANK